MIFKKIYLFFLSAIISFGNLKYLSVSAYEGTNTQKIILPVSKAFDQTGTELCWAYAFLNALESMYLSTHPFETLELSRAYIQYLSIQTRLIDKISNPHNQVTERAFPLDAAYFISHYGISQFHDYPDVKRNAFYPELIQWIFFMNATPEKQRFALTYLYLPKFFSGFLPIKTNFRGEELTAKEFGKRLLGNGTWINYSPSGKKDHYIATDPEIRDQSKTHFIPQLLLTSKIYRSLSKGRPVVYSTHVHSMLIYGIEVNANGEALTFYIKDSVSPKFFYTVNPGEFFEYLANITFLEE